MSQPPRDAVMHEYVKVLKMPTIGRAYPALARVEPEHHLAQRDEVVAALFGGSELTHGPHPQRLGPTGCEP